MIEIKNLIELSDHLLDLKAIIFDLDDTLYSEKEYVRSGYKAVSDYLGGGYEEKLWSYFEAGKPAIDELLKEIGRAAEKDKLLSIYRSHKPDIHLYPGVSEMIGDLKVKGIKVGIITDGRPEGQRAKIKELGLGNLVDHIIITDELGGIEYRKPSKFAFLRMRELLDVPFEEMYYVGDNIMKDFVAPEMLGMRCIWFRNMDGLYYLSD